MVIEALIQWGRAITIENLIVWRTLILKFNILFFIYKKKHVLLFSQSIFRAYNLFSIMTNETMNDNKVKVLVQLDLELVWLQTLLIPEKYIELVSKFAYEFYSMDYRKVKVDKIENLLLHIINVVMEDPSSL